MSRAQDRLFKVLLILCALCIALVIAGIIVMEHKAGQNGGGEMAESIGLLVGLLLLGYYAMVMVLGALLRRQGSARWGWYFLGLLFALLVVPVVFLWQVVS